MLYSVGRTFASASLSASRSGANGRSSWTPLIRTMAIHSEGRTGSTMRNEDHETLDRAKEKHLKGESEVAIPGAEGWSQTLASASEAVVKADKAPDLSVEKMQSHTVDIIKQVYEDQRPSPKTGLDVSGQPSVQENLKNAGAGHA